MVTIFFVQKETIKLETVKRRRVVFTAKDYTIPLFVMTEIKRLIRIRKIPLAERLITQQRTKCKAN